MIELRPLDTKYFPAVYEWTERYPWPAEVDYEEWSKQMLNRLTAALFFEDKLLAVFSFDPLGRGVFELHLDFEPGLRISSPEYDALVSGGLNVRKQLFEDGSAQLVVGWVVAANRAVIRIAEECGLKWDGVEMFKGKRWWIRLSITRQQHEQQKQTNEHYDTDPEWFTVGAVQ